LTIEDGVARTKNRRVKVKMIAEKHLISGESAAAVADHYAITLSDVYAALAYYYDHQAEFELEAARNQEVLKTYGISADEQLAELRRKHGNP
jgi:uncharacterized protein (DUF433 family)